MEILYVLSNEGYFKVSVCPDASEYSGGDRLYHPACCDRVFFLQKNGVQTGAVNRKYESDPPWTS